MGAGARGNATLRTRRSADDGYAVFASIAALKALGERGVPNTRASWSSSSSPRRAAHRISRPTSSTSQKRSAEPSLVVCLDSGAGNYEQLWSTTSLRGLVGATLRVDVLTEGVHSGDASGIVPSSFRVARRLLSRLEDESTGAILPEGAQRRDSGRSASSRRGPSRRFSPTRSIPSFPGHGSMKPVGYGSHVELILNRTWRPALSITGQEGMPPLESAGNVLRPYTTLTLSLRLPPTLDPHQARDVLSTLLTDNPPYGAKVTLDFHEPAPGWNAPALAPWLGASLDEASSTFYGKPALHMGEGGSIPFMGMLGDKFPEAQFLITGVLGSPEQRARAERVPRDRLREEAHLLRRARSRRASPPSRVDPLIESPPARRREWRRTKTSPTFRSLRTWRSSPSRRCFSVS